MAKDTKTISSDDMEPTNNGEKTDTTDCEPNADGLESYGSYTAPVTTSSTGGANNSSSIKENPFSFKHFLKRDSPSSATANNNNNNSATSTTSSSSHMPNINHSLSTSNINNGNGEVMSECATSSSPSKSATTSSLSSQNATGARPKIPQFQSVNTLATESKMKRSPRFPSFDSQSSLSELGVAGGSSNSSGGGGGNGGGTNDAKWSMTNLLHSQSNSSFNADFVSDPVQRSYSTYDIELPPMTLSPKYDQQQGQQQPRSIHNNSPTGNYTTNNSSREDSLTSNNGGPLNRLGTAEFSAALPDFVQDHLVMEQWYTMSGNGSPSSVDFDQLPDFAVNNLEADFNSSRDRSSRHNDIPFDILSFSSSATSHPLSRTPVRRNSPTAIMPLDLPDNSTISLPGGRYGRRSDIQPDITTTEYHYHPNLDVGGGNREEKIQTLPDFLSDGPARLNNNSNSSGGQDHIPHFNSPDDHAHIQNNSSMSRLSHENSRLRDELEDCRRIMAEQSRQINDLEGRLAETRSKESQYNASLLEQVEENLDRSNKRTAAAQTAANKLKLQVKQLTAEIEILRRENEALKEEEAGGAVGGAGIHNRRSQNHQLAPQAQQLSQELRLAAATAENNLRQLLTGVDNLRIMAVTLESLHTAPPNHPNLANATIISESDFLSDSDENDFTGPAL